MRVLVKERPRTLALLSGEHVLTFRYLISSNPEKKQPPKCIVEFAEADSVEMYQYKVLSSEECFGFLGLIEIDGDVYLCCITRKALAASPRPHETVYRIYGVEFYSLNKSDWDYVFLDANGIGVQGQTSEDQRGIEHPCANLRKILSNGSFYYSANFDLTSPLQNRGPNIKAVTVDSIDNSYMWNSYMISQLIQFRSHLPEEQRTALDQGGFLTTVIRGFAGSSQVRVGHGHAQLTVISRQSWKMAGTRFNARGVDDDGNTANFVVTETVLCMPNSWCFGYTQVRGSVPIFWEQDINLLSVKVNLTRSVEATQPAFMKHLEDLMQRFGSVHIVNLLADKPVEQDITRRFEQHIEASTSLKSNIGYTHFDFHAETARGGYAGASRILPRIQDPIIEFGFYSWDASRNQDATEQIGIFRTNCLDCLDRTNMVQQLISREALDIFLDYNNIYPTQDLWAKHNVLWADNGDQLSQNYAGTNALKTSYTRSGKMGIAGALADVTKSVGRLYINNFVDKGRQHTMDILLGRMEWQIAVELHDPINDYVTAELNKRRQEFSSSRMIKVFAGTFNLNGVTAETNLCPWLFPHDERDEQLPDLYLIGFQELVELTPGQILNADQERKVFWESHVLQCLNTRDEYVLLRSGQLVGTALMLYVKKSEVLFIKNVEGSTKKTGLGGMAGNKGGVAVSFNFANTSFCFITAHLAAGQNNIDERHQDYKTLSSGLRFSRGKKIKDHESIIWLGDFNYRVTLSNERCRELIERREFGAILQYDQLNSQMVKGATFPYFYEMEIKFPPTYKFDNGTDVYDTSEKARTPSWTDRILSRGSNLRQLSYGSAPLLFSDHRPVYATFAANVTIIDEKIREKLNRELYEKRKAELGNTDDISNLIDMEDETLTHGLPPPSSDSNKWWIQNGYAAKVNLPVRPGTVINKKSSPNPFSLEATREPDFVRPPLPPRPVGHKTRPVVPKKPVHLQSVSSRSESFSSRESDSSSVNGSVRPVSRTGSSTSIRSCSGSTGALPPPPPPRSRASSRSTQASNNGSLLEETANSVDWAPLQPSSH